jgi:serine/threonine protein kinase
MHSGDGRSSRPLPIDVPGGYRVGDWTVGAVIATGSWASVYEGRRTSERHDSPRAERVALKFLATGTVTARQLRQVREMADRELRFHRHADHRHIIRCHDVLTVDDARRPDLDGAVVLVLERAQRSVADLLAEHAGRPTPTAAGIVEDVCAGLAAMHNHGWVHGDVKPSNLLVMRDGSVRLADFGLTAELEGTHAYLLPYASASYVPPERWTEQLVERGTPVRPTADVWALGVTAYQLFTGHFPFPGSDQRAHALAACEYATGRVPLLFPSHVPPGWQDLIRCCLAPTHKDRARWDTPALLTRIAALRRHQHRAYRPRRRPRTALRVGGSAAAAAAVVAMVIPAAWRWHSAPTYREPVFIPTAQASGSRSAQESPPLPADADAVADSPDNLVRAAPPGGEPAIFASSHQSAYPPAYAADGDLGTFWVSDGFAPGDGPSPKHPVVLTVDLNVRTTISTVTVRPRPQYGPKNYAIQISDDGRAWHTIARVGQAADSAVITAVTPSTGRYLRLWISEARDVRSPSRNVQIIELEAYR